MFAAWILENPLSAPGLLLLIALYWRLLGLRFDARIFIALNFSIITLWVFTSSFDPIFRLAALSYIALLTLANRMQSQPSLARRLDRFLEVDTSVPLLIIASLGIITNLSSGYVTLEDKAMILEQQAADPRARYSTYLLISAAWLTVHVINTAGTQRSWTLMQRLAVLAATVAAATGLSKASILPIIMTLLFVYSKKLGAAKVTVLLSASIGLTLLLIQRLLQDAPDGVTLVFISRILQNVDVLDYIENLGMSEVEQYPHISPFYLFWPFFQATQHDFIVAGTWLHGQLVGDWRGYGPNPTFLIDQLIASQYFGFIFAPVFGVMLRAADRARYRVFVAMLCYSFLQDWYFASLNLLTFLFFLTLCKLLGQRQRALPVRRVNS